MGCDIHFHSEVKIKGKWQHYSHSYVNRYYGLFYKMAGVRKPNGTITPLSNPKGYPEDASCVSKLDSEKYGTDGHSHSWLSAEEIKLLYKWLRGLIQEDVLPYNTLRDNFGYLFGNHWDDFHSGSSSTTDTIEDIRFVFFFDN